MKVTLEFYKRILTQLEHKNNNEINTEMVIKSKYNVRFNLKKLCIYKVSLEAIFKLTVSWLSEYVVMYELVNP